MENIKSTPSQEPASVAPTTIAQSQPPSPATTAPLNTRPNKRKLGSEDGSTNKRLQVEPPSRSAQVVSPESSEVNRHSQEEKQDQVSQQETNNRYQYSPTLELRQDQHSDAQAYGLEYNQDDQPTDVPNHGTGNRYHERKDQPPSEPRQSSPAKLSRANLKLLQQKVTGFDEMDNEVASSGRGRKRAASRQTSNSDIASTRSKESAPSPSFYRFSILDQANVYIYPEPPPARLQSQLDSIFKPKVPEHKKRDLSGLAKETSPKFSRLLRGAHREDDLVELVQETLRAMHKDEILTHPRKADWNLDLKPTIQQQHLWNFNTRVGHAVDANETLNPSGNPQQADRPFPSPDTSKSSMPPPAAPRVTEDAPQFRFPQDSAVKTPRPDFTWGFHQSTITDALVQRGLVEPRASRLLPALQREQNLCSDPTQHFLDVRFPILIIEGKAYTTGKTLFEAENQAAVSGSSMLILQRQLETLYKDVVLDSKVEGDKSPLAFSLCTQGPIMELWVHHIVSEDDITEYHMNLIATCHGSISSELERFLVQMDCLIQWYKNEYLGTIADQLFAIASYAAR
ncbi:MAG: hypothetical protein Q9215_004768 [Flavoplaca cf. flavocitrina]